MENKSLNVPGFVLLETPEAPNQDLNSYRSVQLDNGLRVVLVSRGDGEGSGEAACALCVGAGGFSDPEHCQGLANLVAKSITSQPEIVAASTSFTTSQQMTIMYETTCFSFACPDHHLPQILQLYGRAFTEPFFSPELIDKIIYEIHSEYLEEEPPGRQRKWRVLCEAAHPLNPARKFILGNLSSLTQRKTQVLKEVHSFIRTHYVAKNMTLAIESGLPEQVVLGEVLRWFGGLRGDELGHPGWHQPPVPFIRSKFCKLMLTDSVVQGQCELDVNFVLPPLLSNYRSKPGDYLNWILSHEGAGSLNYYLRFKGMASHVKPIITTNSLYSVLTVTFLIPETSTIYHVYSCVKALFSYLKFWTQLEPQRNIFEEGKRVAELQFHLPKDWTMEEKVVRLAQDMQVYPPKDYLRGPYLVEDFRPDLIQAVLNSLQPEEANILVACDCLMEGKGNTEKERYWHTRYVTVEYPPEWLDVWRNEEVYLEFQVPMKNRMLPEAVALAREEGLVPRSKSLELYERPDRPSRVIDHLRLEVWHLRDPTQPFAYIYIHLITNMVTSSSPVIAVLLDLYITSIEQILRQQIYLASQASLSFNISLSPFGCTLFVQGLAPLATSFLSTILHTIPHMKHLITSVLFDQAVRLVRRTYVNNSSNVWVLVKDMKKKILIDGYKMTVEKLAAMSEVNLEFLQEFSQAILEDMCVQVLMEGNITKNEAALIGNDVELVLQLKKTEISLPRVQGRQLVRREMNVHVVPARSTDESCVTSCYYQTKHAGLKPQCTVELMIALLKGPALDALWVRERLGYVNITLNKQRGVLGFTITVASKTKTHSLDYIDQAIHKLLVAFLHEIPNIPLKEFNRIRRRLVESKTPGSLPLSEVVQRHWREIKSRKYQFSRESKEAQVIPHLTVSDVEKLLEDTVALGLRKLCVQGISREDRAVSDTMSLVVQSEERDKKTFLTRVASIDSWVQLANKISPATLVKDVSLSVPGPASSSTPIQQHLAITTKTNFPRRLPNTAPRSSTAKGSNRKRYTRI